MSDPLYQRLIRDVRMPRFPGPIGVALSVAVITLIAAQAFRTASMSEVRAVILMPIAVLLLTPILTVGYAAVITASYAVSDEYAMLRMSPIPRDALVWAYFRAVLYRLQMLYALALGLLPLPLIMLAGTVLFQMWLRDTPQGVAALLIGLAADNIAAAALGVFLGLRLRRPLDASLIGVSLFAALPVLFVIATPTALATTYYVPYIFVERFNWASLVLKSVVIILPVLTLPMLRWAERWT